MNRICYSYSVREEQLTILFSIPPLELRKKLLECVEKFHGIVLKTFGEAYVFGFTDPREACDAALSFRGSLPAETEWRAGIAFGEVTVAQNDVFGEAVNMAARLEGVAGNGEILTAESYRLASDGRGVHLTDLGPRTFKGMAQPVRLFALTEKEEAPPPPPPKKESPPVPSPSPVARGISQEKVDQPAPAPKLSVVPPTVEPIAKGIGVGHGTLAIGIALAVILGSTSFLLFRKGSSSEGGTYATLTIRSKPESVEVFIENKEVAKQTPVKINQVPPNRNLKIRVQKEGFEDSTQIVKLAPKESRVVEISLKPEKKGRR